jgi:hypothetical protein
MPTTCDYFTVNFAEVFGTDYLTATHSLHYGDWLRKTFKSEIIEVEVRHDGMTGSGYQSLCHDNVVALVMTYGGARVGGFVVNDDIHIIKGEKCLRLVYHSVWLTPENKLVDVTANNFTTESSVNFLPVVIDTVTSVEFDDIYLETRGVLTSVQRDPHQTSDFAKRHDYKLIEFSNSNDSEEIYDVLALIPYSDFKLEMISDDLSSAKDRNRIINKVFDSGGFRNPSSATGKKFDEIVSFRANKKSRL